MSRTNHNHIRPDIQRLSEEGWNASEIADQLQVSIDTVRYHQKKGMPYSARKIEAKITVSDIRKLRQQMREGDKIKTRGKLYILKKLPHGVLVGKKSQKISYQMITYADLLLSSQYQN